MSKSFETHVENIELKNKQIFNCPVSNAEVTTQQVFGDKPVQESQTTEPPPAHQKGNPVDLKMYDSSDVLDLTMKGGNSRSATTSSSPVTTEEAENLDDTIIYQGTNEDEQPEIIEIPEHDEFTSVGRGRYFLTSFFDDMEPEVVTKVPEDMDGKSFTCSKLL